MKQILIVAVQDGHHYQLFLVPEEELKHYDLDTLDNLYYEFHFDPTWDPNEIEVTVEIPKGHKLLLYHQGYHQAQLWQLWKELEEGCLNKYTDPSMPMTCDRVIQIGMAG
jgi:hypothetical protein